MPNVSLTDPTTGTTVASGLVATNNANLRSVLNGNLDTANWAAGKIFAPTKLMQEGATDLQFLQWKDASGAWVPAGAWGAYTPAWTSSGTAPALNNGTIVGKYIQLGKTVIGRAVLTMGSTTTFGTGTYFISVPVSAAAADVGTTVGITRATDLSAVNNRTGQAGLNDAAKVFIESNVDPSVAYTNLAPFTWAVGDILVVHFTYEAA